MAFMDLLGKYNLSRLTLSRTKTNTKGLDSISTALWELPAAELAIVIFHCQKG